MSNPQMTPSRSTCSTCGDEGPFYRYHSDLHCIQNMYDEGKSLSSDQLATLFAYAWTGLERSTR